MDLFLFREFCRHAYLGQWELARSYAIALAENEKSDNQYNIKLKLTLLELSQSPALVKSCWSAFPSPSYAAFLALKLLSKCFHDENSEDVGLLSIARTAECNIMVEDLFNKCQQKHIWELSHAHLLATKKCIDSVKEKTSLSSDVLKIIRGLLLKDPTVISSFFGEMCLLDNHNHHFPLALNICDIYIDCLTYILRHLETSCAQQKTQQLNEFSSKLCNFMSLIPEQVLVNYRSKMLQTDLNVVLTSILCLCESECLSFEQVYSSLILRTKPSFLQYFCVKEDEKIGFTSNSNISSYLDYCRTNQTINLKKILLSSVKKNKHFLENILVCSTEQVLSGNYSEVMTILEHMSFERLKPLIFLLSWNICSDDTSFTNVATAVKEWHPTADDDVCLVEIGKKLLTNISFKERCINYYNKQFPDVDSKDIALKACNLFNMVQSQSPLNVLQRAFGLKNISPEVVIGIVDAVSSGMEEIKYHDEMTIKLSQDSIIYHGYLSITYVMEAILCSYSINQIMEKSNCPISRVLYENEPDKYPIIVESLDEGSENTVYKSNFLNQFISKHGFQAAYSKFVVERLEKAKQELDTLYPINFRLEILENLFSLLFISSEDILENLSHSDSDEGHEGEEKHNNSLKYFSDNHSSKNFGSASWSKSLFSDEIVEKKSNKIGIVENKRLGRFIISSVQSKECGPEYGDSYSGHGSSRSTGSTGCSSMSMTGFLCCELFVRDYVMILKDAIVSINAEIYKARKSGDHIYELQKSDLPEEQDEYKAGIFCSIQENEMQKRVRYLQKYINEAVWRFELVQLNEKHSIERNFLSTGILTKTGTTKVFKQRIVNEISSATLSGTDNGSDGGNRKHGKKKKYKQSSKKKIFHYKYSQLNVIQRMLSTPSALLRHCLWEQNYKKASEVVNWYDLQSIFEAKELIFAKDVTNLSAKVKEATTIQEKAWRKPVNKKSSSAKDMVIIANAAASGLHSSSAISVIEQEIRQMEIPEIPEVIEIIEQLGPSEKYLFCGVENIHSLALADLAYTQGFSLRSSTVIIERAMQQLEEYIVSSKKKNVNFSRGCLETMNMMLLLINCFQSFSADERNKSKTQSVFFPLISECFSFSECVVSYLGPIESLAFLKYLQVWKNVSVQIEDFISLLEKEDEFEHNQFLMSESKLNGSYTELEKTVLDVSGWSIDSVKPQRSKYRNYLKKLYCYLKQVANALMCYKDDKIIGTSPYTSYFSVLKESPPDILQKMVLQKKISDEKIEKFALSMKVDLTQVLLDSFFSKIPLQMKNKCDCFHYTENQEPISLDKPKIILNHSSQSWLSPRHPVVAACEILKKFISIVQDVTIVKDAPAIFFTESLLSLVEHPGLPSWLHECSELAYVDLELLQNSDEKFAFFVNVTNIAWMHALLMAADAKCSEFYSESKKEHLSPMISPILLERIMWQKLCGYSVGQLGTVSLFDLRYCILHSNFAFPKHLDLPPYNVFLRDPENINPLWRPYILPAQSKLLFVLCEGFVYSPKLQVMHSEIISSQLDEAVKDYVNFTVRVDMEKKHIFLPQLLEFYCLDFDSQQGKCKSSYEGLVDWISSFTKSELTESLRSLLSADMDLPSGQKLDYQIFFEPVSVVPCLRLAYSSDADCRIPPNDAKMESDVILFPESSILKYIKEKCSIIANIFSIAESEGKYDEDKTWPLFSYSPVDYHPITHLLKRSQIWASETLPDASQTSFSSPIDEKAFAWLLSALNPTPLRNYTLQKIEDSIKRKQWMYSLYYVDSFMEFQKQSDPCFVLARNVILQYMSNSEFMFGEKFTDTFNWTLCISDSVNMSQNVLQNVHKWTVQSSIKALKFCLSDLSVKKDITLCSSLKLKLKKIEVYEKILNAIKDGNVLSEDSAGIFTEWQDVAEYSTWDQRIVLNYLKECGQYNLVNEWAKFNKIDSSAKLMVSAMQIIWLLGQSPPLSSEAYEIFESIGDSSDYIELSNLVFSELSSEESKLCFVKFMLKADLDYEHILYFLNMGIGLKMLQAVRSDARENYDTIVAHPKLLLEQLLMNMEVKEAEKALEAVYEDLQSEIYMHVELSPLAINQLLEYYASKALEMPIFDDLNDSTVSDATILNSEEVINATDESEKPFAMPSHVPSKSEWTEDSKVTTCQVCKDEQFSMFSRRHHCRRCGRVVCSNCSQKTLIIEGYGKFAVRVCDDCYSQSVYDRISGSRSPSARSFSVDKRFQILSSMNLMGRSSFSLSASEITDTKQRTASFASRELFCWTLTGNKEQDDVVRSEFFFDPAPSVSLCLSILKLHSNSQQCANFMLSLCDKLIEKLQPKRSKSGSSKVDYFLIISMVRTFILNAQIKYRQLQHHEGENLADGYLLFLDVIKMLINQNCAHLIPTGDLLVGKTVRDSLVLEERMSFALDICTNFGLDKKCVWFPWGMSCLQSGDFIAAREKFKQCLKVPRNPNSIQQESPFLIMVVNAFENFNCGAEKDSAISSVLSSLEEMKKGVYEFQKTDALIGNRIKEECLYYLKTYGSYISTVSFYQRHSCINEALNYILDQKCTADVFIEGLFLPLLKQGKLSVLQSSLTSNDLTLSKWWNYLLATCRYLKNLGYQNVLYQMQLFMEDYIRAAKSSIKFYLSPALSYDTLFKRHHHLHNAKKHFETYKRNYGSSYDMSIMRHIMKIPMEEVDRYLQVIKLQEEVSDFFKICNSKGLPVPRCENNYSQEMQGTEYFSPPTLFESQARKNDLMKMVLFYSVKVDAGFDLAKKIMEECRLDLTSAACQAVESLVGSQQNEQLPHFMHSLKWKLQDKITMDAVILACITACHSQEYDVSELVNQLESDFNKMNAYLICGKLKSAYILAVKLNNQDDVFRVLEAAKKRGQEAVVQICEKWLNSKQLL